MPRRAILIVLDSVGAGELPDAAAYGDVGSDTLGNLARQVPLAIPTLARLGSVGGDGHARRAGAGGAARGLGPDGRALRRQGLGHRPLGADGHRPRACRFRRFRTGFPPELIARVRGAHRASGRSATSSRRARPSSTRSATQHCATGRPIVYTSADSVFQIAAHEDVVPVARLYEWCQVAYELAVEGPGAGPCHRPAVRRRVRAPSRARPTATTTRCRRIGETLLDRLHGRRRAGDGGGEGGRPVRRARRHAVDSDGQRRRGHGRAGRAADRRHARAALRQPGRFRHASTGIATTSPAMPRTSSGSTRGCRRCWPHLDDDDLLIVTADHGNDPTTPSTDHSREYVPLLVTAPWLTAPRALGVRDVVRRPGTDAGRRGSGVPPLVHGTSFLADLR